MKKIIFILIITLLAGSLFSQEGGQTNTYSKNKDSVYIRCIYPVSKGNGWQYNIFYKKRKPALPR